MQYDLTEHLAASGLSVSQAKARLQNFMKLPIGDHPMDFAFLKREEVSEMNRLLGRPLGSSLQFIKFHGNRRMLVHPGVVCRVCDFLKIVPVAEAVLDSHLEKARQFYIQKGQSMNTDSVAIRKTARLAELVVNIVEKFRPIVEETSVNYVFSPGLDNVETATERLHNVFALLNVWRQLLHAQLRGIIGS